MRTLPRILVGIGDFGLRVLNEVACQVRQAYDEDGLEPLALLGFDFAPQRPAHLDHAVDYLSIYADPTDWLTNSIQRPHLDHWLDRAYFRNKIHTISPDSSDRQLARLFLFRYLDQEPQTLFTLFGDHIKKTMAYFRRDPRMVTSIGESSHSMTIFLLGALTDSAMSGCFLDLAHLLRLSAPGQALNIILYLALPSSLMDISRNRNGYTLQASAYAVLRELERFSTGRNWWRIPRRIDYGIPNPASQQIDEGYQLINTTRLYSELLGDLETAHEDLAMLWADCLVPQLDAHFGNILTQHLDANQEARKQDAFALTEDMPLRQSTFVVERNEVRAAVFPRRLLLENWAHRLGHEVFSIWMQSNTDYIFPIRRLQRWANGEQLQNPFTRDDYYCPTLISDILDWYDNPDYADHIAIDLVNNPNRLSRTLSHLAIQVTEPLGDQVISEQVERYTPDVDAFHWAVIGLLKGEFGVLQTGISRRGGAYWRRLRPTFDNQKERFTISLLALVLRLLNEERAGFQNALEMLHFLVKALEKAETVLVRALNYHQENMQEYFGDMAQTLDFRRGYIEKLPAKRQGVGRWFNRNVNTVFDQYLQTLRQMVDRMSSETILLRLVDLLKALHTEATVLFQQLQDWEQILLQDADGLGLRLETATAHSIAKLRAVPSRYWLVDNQWAAARYTDMFDDEVQHDVLAALNWQVQGYMDDFAIVPLVGGVVLDSRRIDSWQEQNYARWTAFFLRQIDTRIQAVDLWKYVLSSDAEQGHVQQVATFLSQWQDVLPYTRRVEVSRDPEVVEYLVTPPEVATTQSESTYRQQLRTALELVETHTEEAIHTRLLRFSLTQLIPLRSLDAYAALAEVYRHNQGIPIRQRHVLYILPEEVQAARYERDIAAYFKDSAPFRFSDSLVLALGVPERVESFLWAWVTGLVKQEVYGRQSGTIFALSLPGTGDVWWLSPEHPDNLVEAFVRFCMADLDPVSYGDPITYQKASIDYQIVQNEIDHHMNSAAQDWMNDWRANETAFPDPEVGGWIQQLQSTDYATQAARYGYDRRVMRVQLEDSIVKSGESLSPDELALQRLFAVVANRIIQQRHHDIRDMMTRIRLY